MLQRHFSLILVSFFVLAAMIVHALSVTVYAQVPNGSTGSPQVGSARLKTEVSGRVGEFYLNLSGYTSPFASIVLTVDGHVYRTTVANQDGTFSITGILIKEGFDGFCLEAVDFKRLGESITCFNVPPAKGSIEMHDIFLPPTIGLQRSTIEAGGDGVVFGYTMPGAEVTIHSDACPPNTVASGECGRDKKIFKTTADQSGYYEVTIENLPAGSYSLFATATFGGRPSESPSNTVKLTALTWWQLILIWIKNLLKRITELFTSLGLGPLWLVFPLMPLITWLIIRIWPEHFTWIYNSKLYAFFARKKRRKLHHAWFMGY